MIIVMCKESRCYLSEKCLRFTATPNSYWQDYLPEVKEENKLGRACSHYKDNSK